MTQTPRGGHSRSQHEKPPNARNCRDAVEPRRLHSSSQATTQATKTCLDAAGAEIRRPFSRFSEAWATLEPTIVTALLADETEARNHAVAASESDARS